MWVIAFLISLLQLCFLSNFQGRDGVRFVEVVLQEKCNVALQMHSPFHHYNHPYCIEHIWGSVIHSKLPVSGVKWVDDPVLWTTVVRPCFDNYTVLFFCKWKVLFLAILQSAMLTYCWKPWYGMWFTYLQYFDAVKFDWELNELSKQKL